jgi:hypothetical protein
MMRFLPDQGTDFIYGRFTKGVFRSRESKDRQCIRKMTSTDLQNSTQKPNDKSTINRQKTGGILLFTFLLTIRRDLNPHGIVPIHVNY